MPLATLLQLVQILSAAGSAAVELTKVVEAVRARGDTKLTPAELTTVRSHVEAHVNALTAIPEDAFDEMTALEETSGA